MTPRTPRFDVVCFDCDSTLSRIEGIDELARRAGVENEVVPLTAAAMAGTMSLDAVYARRLSVVRPDRASVAWLSTRYVEEMVPGARETIAALNRAGKSVHIVSGGLRPALEPLARILEIPASYVHAVDVIFEDDGTYRDFDGQSPLSRHDGKAVVCRALAAGHHSVALVGDGASDLFAHEFGVFVIGFGGVVRREALVRDADIFVDGPDLTAVLGTLLGAEEPSLSAQVCVSPLSFRRTNANWWWISGLLRACLLSVWREREKPRLGGCDVEIRTVDHS